MFRGIKKGRIQDSAFSEFDTNVSNAYFDLFSNCGIAEP
ncbi:hypothetical protein J537_1886 [Acinetobacter baumannii 1437282]|nr:hypothetical protein J537_1886 [Acinetobacter baumannii 1437282]